MGWVNGLTGAAKVSENPLDHGRILKASDDPDKFERLEMGFPDLVPLGDALKIGEQEFKAFAGRKLV